MSHSREGHGHGGKGHQMGHGGNMHSPHNASSECTPQLSTHTIHTISISSSEFGAAFYHIIVSYRVHG